MDECLWVNVRVDLVGKDVISVQYMAEALSVNIDTVEPTVIDVNNG